MSLTNPFVHTKYASKFVHSNSKNESWMYNKMCALIFIFEHQIDYHTQISAALENYYDKLVISAALENYYDKLVTVDRGLAALFLQFS